MIVLPQDTKFNPQEGSSSDLGPPPPFHDQQGPLIDFSDGSDAITIAAAHDGEIPPPAFTPYEAECFNSGGNLISHDPHLNVDGEALYRFLLSQNFAPQFRLWCRGSHTETRYRHVTERRDGHTRTRRESYTETVVDFDFYIDASNFCDPVQWSVDDSEPVYRGSMVREIDSPQGKRKATRSEIKEYKRWLADRTARGLPPWVSALPPDGSSTGAVVLKSSRSLRQWADEYCASPKYLKEFTYEKVPYGWNVRQLENAIRSSIQASPYHGDIQVEFRTTGSTIYIRPDNTLSRMLSNKWLKFLSIILLIFPFVWLFKRFHSRGGGKWAICGSAHPLKRWVPVEPELVEVEPTKGRPPNAAGSNIVTQDGAKRLVGVREGEWFRRWQPTILRAVSTRYQSSTPLYQPSEEGAAAMALDGY